MNVRYFCLLYSITESIGVCRLSCAVDFFIEKIKLKAILLSPSSVLYGAPIQYLLPPHPVPFPILTLSHENCKRKASYELHSVTSSVIFHLPFIHPPSSLHSPSFTISFILLLSPPSASHVMLCHARYGDEKRMTGQRPRHLYTHFPVSHHDDRDMTVLCHSYTFRC